MGRLLRTLAFLVSLSIASSTSAAQSLRGVVKDDKGKPVANAMIAIRTARLRSGYSTYCPSCYADCGKSTRTDATGSFTFADLDDTLVFRIAVVADGFAPAPTKEVDPAKEPTEIALKPRPMPAGDDPRVLRGRIVNAEGNPLRFAMINPEGAVFTDGRNTYGRLSEFDPFAITDVDGRFALYSEKPFASVDVSVEARGYALTLAAGLVPGATVHEIIAREGSQIHGRVTQNGKGVANVLVGAAQLCRRAGIFVGEKTIGTDAQGYFAFENVSVVEPAERTATDSNGNVSKYREVSNEEAQTWNVYAKMESISQIAASPIKSCRVDVDGKSIDVGDIELKPGITISGRVVLSDRKPIAPGMHISAGLDAAWDTQTVPLAEDGSFTFANLPAGEAAIFPSVKGYFLSRKNPSISWSLEGTIDHDLKGFLILMEPGVEDFKDLVGGRNHNTPLVGIDQKSIDAIRTASP